MANSSEEQSTMDTSEDKANLKPEQVIIGEKLNGKSMKGYVPIKGLTMSIYKYQKNFLELMIEKIKVKMVDIIKDTNTLTRFNESLKDQLFLVQNIYDAGLYAFTSYRTSYIALPHLAGFPDYLNEYTNEEEYRTKAPLINLDYVKQNESHIHLNEIKKNRQPKITISIAKGTQVVFDTSEVAKLYVCCMMGQRVWPTAGFHMTTVKKITCVINSFVERFRDYWYQEGGKKSQKNITKLQKRSENYFRRFDTLGVDRAFYHHTWMINYSKETKSELRNSTGIATDFIDLMDLSKKSTTSTLFVEKEKKKIEEALKIKLRMLSPQLVASVIDLIKDNADNPKSLHSIMSAVFAICTIKMANYDYRLAFPAVCLLKWTPGSFLPDISSIGAFRMIKLIGGNTFIVPYVESQENLAYAMAGAFLGFVLADQRLMEKFFVGLQPKRRDEFQPKLEKSTSDKFSSVIFPNLAGFSKMYNGEAGRGGGDQEYVLHPIAARTIYRSEDFQIFHEDYDFVSGYSNSLSGVYGELSKILIKCQTELRNSPTVAFGTQKYHLVNEIDNETLSEGTEISLSHGNVVTYYSRSDSSSKRRTSASIGSGAKRFRH